MGVLKDFIEMPPMDPSLPGIFYLGQPGDLMGRMKAAGFAKLTEEEVPVEGIYTSGREYLECLQEVAAPLQTLFAKVPAEKRRAVEDGITAAAEKFRRDGKVRIPGVALAVSGIKPL